MVDAELYIFRTDAGLSERFEVKVGLHQGSVLSQLMFAAIMDVVSGETRNGLPSELLYADDLVVMAPTIRVCTYSFKAISPVG